MLVFESGKGSERTHLRLVHEKEIRGAPFSMDVLNGKLIVAINRYSLSYIQSFVTNIDVQLCSVV